MVITKEQLNNLKEQYEKSLRLTEGKEYSTGTSGEGPDDTFSFHQHCMSQDILKEMEINVNNLLMDLSATDDPDEEQDRIKLLAILGFIYRDIGKIYLWCSENSDGEYYLLKCVEHLEIHRQRPESIICYNSAKNELGLMYSKRRKIDESIKHLRDAESNYKTFISNDNKEDDKIKIQAITIFDIFNNEIDQDKGTRLFEQTYTLTLFLLAQVLGITAEHYSSAIYCHSTLRRQLESNDYEPIDWILNAASLSQYFCGNNYFTESRHHLAAAMFMLKKYESEMDDNTKDFTDEQRKAYVDNFVHRSADVQRCWAKYGINLLCESKMRLCTDDDDDDHDDIKKNKKKDQKRSKVDAMELSTLRFTSIDVTEYENVISDSYCLTYEDAKPVFQSVQSWLNIAKEYYTADTEATEYSKIILDKSELYKYLIFFEDDESNQCKLNKRRADMLEDLSSLLNPTYYLNICREIWFELGSVYTGMLNAKLDILQKLKIHENPTPHSIKKINLLCGKGIEVYDKFLDSYKDKRTNQLRDDIPSDEYEIILFAYFHIGRLYYKIINPDKRNQLINLQNSVKYYTLLVKGCEDRPDMRKLMKSEYGVCKEMITLIPVAMKDICKHLEISESLTVAGN